RHVDGRDAALPSFLARRALDIEDLGYVAPPIHRESYGNIAPRRGHDLAVVHDPVPFALDGLDHPVKVCVAGAPLGVVLDRADAVLLALNGSGLRADVLSRRFCRLSADAGCVRGDRLEPPP